jgi:hypothetical protein
MNLTVPLTTGALTPNELADPILAGTVQNVVEIAYDRNCQAVNKTHLDIINHIEQIATSGSFTTPFPTVISLAQVPVDQVAAAYLMMQSNPGVNPQAKTIVLNVPIFSTATDIQIDSTNHTLADFVTVSTTIISPSPTTPPTPPQSLVGVSMGGGYYAFNSAAGAPLPDGQSYLDPVSGETFIFHIGVNPATGSPVYWFTLVSK